MPTPIAWGPESEDAGGPGESSNTNTAKKDSKSHSDTVAGNIAAGGPSGPGPALSFMTTNPNSQLALVYRTVNQSDNESELQTNVTNLETNMDIENVTDENQSQGQ